jgi:hypothetical protein
MGDLQSAMEDYLSHLPQDEWRALCARVREPHEPLPPAEKERTQ